MNPNDLPLKEKLAALIEAGRACNPDMAHLHGDWGDGKHSGCAMTFALKAAGLDYSSNWPEQLAEHMGADSAEVFGLARSVMRMNDAMGASIPEIITAIREETLPPALRLPPIAFPSLGSYIWIAPAVYGVDISSAGDFSVAWDASIVKREKAKPEPAKKVRASTRTGKTWPAPKGCYA